MWYFDDSDDSESFVVEVLEETARLFAAAGIELSWRTLEVTSYEFADDRLVVLDEMWRRGQPEVCIFFPRAWSSGGSSDFHGEATTPSAVNRLRGAGGITVAQEYEGRGFVPWQVVAQEVGHYLGLPHLDVVVEDGDDPPQDLWTWLAELLGIATEGGESEGDDRASTETTMPDGRYFSDVAFHPFPNDTPELDTYEAILTNVMKTGYFGAAGAADYKWTPSQVLRMRLTIISNTSGWAKAIDVLDSLAAGVPPLPAVRLSGMATTVARCLG